LAAAIDHWTRILVMLPREKVPLKWAEAQTLLGNALEALVVRFN